MIGSCNSTNDPTSISHVREEFAVATLQTSALTPEVSTTSVKRTTRGARLVGYGRTLAAAVRITPILSTCANDFDVVFIALYSIDFGLMPLSSSLKRFVEFYLLFKKVIF